jgi:beta-glucanase (GH16 family)
VGQFPGTVYGSKWDVYPDGTPDTNHWGVYEPSKVLSVHDGVLDWYLHTENGKPMTATAVPAVTGSNPYKGLTYGRYVTRFKVTQSAPRFSQTFLLWPDSEKWPDDGEFDFPAGDLGDTLHSASIFANHNLQTEGFGSPARFTSWHTATLEWTPGKARFYIDGDPIGTTTQQVASNPMHYVLQVETTENGPGLPDPNLTTDLQLDWIAVYSYSPSTQASPGATDGGGGGGPVGGGGGGGGSAVTARIAVKPGRCARQKVRTVSGAIELRFPAATHNRKARLAGKHLRRFASIDTTTVTNGHHKIAFGYNKTGHRRMHGCAWVNVAN